jgi:Tol biopolymer transport system component
MKRHLWLLVLALAGCGAPAAPLPLHVPGPDPAETSPSPSAAPAVRIDGRLAFSRGHNIWILEGDTARQLTDLGSIQNPAWSPDGSLLAFDRADKNSADLWLLPYPHGPARAISSNASRVVDNNFWDMQPAWSPDGASLVYASDRGRTRTGTLDLAAWRLNLSTRARTQLTGANLYTGGIDYPSFRPGSSSEVLYTSWTYLLNNPEAFGQLMLLDTKTMKAAPLTGAGQTAMQASWSPDGEYVAFVRRLQGENQIWLAPFPARGSLLDEATLLVGGTNAHPVWSPRGDAIAYIGLQDGSFDLFLQPLNGDLTAAGKPRQLTRRLRVDADSSISWTA